MTAFTLRIYNQIISGLEQNRNGILQHSEKELRAEKEPLKKFRKQELLALRRVPKDIAIERNTWFHLGVNSDQQFIYTLRRMLDPIKEHVENGFSPIPEELISEYEPIHQRINDLLKSTETQISTGRYDDYRTTMANADRCKDDLSVLRKRHIDRMQEATDNSRYQIDLVYLNVLQESQQLLSNMRHQLRAAKKFIRN